VPIGLPYFTTGSPDGIRVNAILCPLSIVSRTLTRRPSASIVCPGDKGSSAVATLSFAVITITFGVTG
jgi:hypothetical protein